MQFARAKDGDIWLEKVEEWALVLLLRIPDLASENLPERARKRLYPDPSDDPELQADWGRHVIPELLSLIASARDLVASDLARIERKDGTFRVPIARAHRQAWISVLNAARLALGAEHELTASDMEAEDFAEWNDRAEAVGTIHVLGWLQGLLIEDVDPEAMSGG